MRTHWVLALVAPFGLLACVRESRVAMRPADPLAVTRTVTRTETAMRPMKEAKEVQLTSLEVSEEIARICELPEAHFPFDSAEIGGGVQQALDKLAACFGQGSQRKQEGKAIQERFDSLSRPSRPAQIKPFIESFLAFLISSV